MNKNDLIIGVAGEHLVCFDLMTKGYNVSMSEQGMSYDLVLDYNSTLLKIQVKTTRTYTPTPQRKKHYPSYRFAVRKHGNGGRVVYEPTDVDIFALVCIETKQVGYIKHVDMPITISVRVDDFKGKYLNELQDARTKEVFRLKSEGMTNTNIGKEVGMDKSVVCKVLKGLSKKTEHGIYFSDLTLEKALKHDK